MLYFFSKKHSVNIMACILGLLFLLTYGIPLYAQDQTIRTVLPNGLVLLVSPKHSSDIVAVEIMLKVSVLDEPVEQAGARQLITQTILRTAQKEKSELDMLGGELSCDVGLDYLEFRAQTLGDGFVPAIDKLAKALTQPMLDTELLAQVKKEQAEYLTILRNDPFQSTYLQLRRGLYDGYPYAREATGERAAVEALTDGDLNAFRARWYLPNNAIIAVCGNVTPEQARDVVEKAFAKWAAAPLPERVTATDESLTASRVMALQAPLPVSEDDTTDSAQLMVGFRAPAAPDSRNFAAFQVLDSLMGRGMSGRMIAVLRNEMGLAYQISTFCPTLAHTSHFVVYAVVSDKLMEDAKETIVTEINRVLQQPVSPADLDAAKNYLIGQYALSRQRNSQRAYYLAWYETLGLGADFETRYPTLIAEVTPESLQAAVQPYLQKMIVSVRVQ
jgi:zinc protease